MKLPITLRSLLADTRRSRASRSSRAAGRGRGGRADRARRRGAPPTTPTLVAHYAHDGDDRSSRRSSSCAATTRTGSPSCPRPRSSRRASTTTSSPATQPVFASPRLAAHDRRSRGRRDDERRARDMMRAARPPLEASSTQRRVGRIRHAAVGTRVDRSLLPDRRRLLVPAVGVSARGDPRRLHAPARRHARADQMCPAPHRARRGGLQGRRLVRARARRRRGRAARRAHDGDGDAGRLRRRWTRRGAARCIAMRATSRSASSTSPTSARTASSGSAGAPSRDCRCRRPSRSRTCRRRDATPACGSTTTSRARSRRGVRLGIRVGYAARNQTVAGFTGGASAAVEF